MALTGLTGQISKFFTIAEYATSANVFGFRTRLTLTYHMSQDLVNHDRSVLTFVAVLGEVGGLYGLLVSIAGTILSFATF